jgi:hypothetical protein
MWEHGDTEVAGKGLGDKVTIFCGARHRAQDPTYAKPCALPPGMGYVPVPMGHHLIRDLEDVRQHWPRAQGQTTWTCSSMQEASNTEPEGQGTTRQEIRVVR